MGIPEVVEVPENLERLEEKAIKVFNIVLFLFIKLCLLCN